MIGKKFKISKIRNSDFSKKMINLSWNKIIHFIKKLFHIKKEFENALKNIYY